MEIAVVLISMGLMVFVGYLVFFAKNPIDNTAALRALTEEPLRLKARQGEAVLLENSHVSVLYSEKGDGTASFELMFDDYRGNIRGWFKNLKLVRWEKNGDRYGPAEIQRIPWLPKIAHEMLGAIRRNLPSS